MDQTNVSNMNGFYTRQYSTDDMERLRQMNNQHAMMGMMRAGSLDPNMVDPQALEELIAQNKELQRRRTYHQNHYGAPPRTNPDNDPRRSSMLEFRSGTGNDLDGFQFDPSPVQTSPTSHPHGGGMTQRLEARRRESMESLGLNTRFQDLPPGFGAMTQSPVYHQGLNPGDSLDLDVTGSYVGQNMSMGMDYVGNGLDQGANGNVSSMNMFSQDDYTSSLTTSPIHQHLSNSIRGPPQDPGGGMLSSGAEQDLMDKLPNMRMSDAMHTMRPNLPQNVPMQGNNEQSSMVQDMQSFKQQADSQAIANIEPPPPPNLNSFATAEPLPNSGPKPSIPVFRNAYSSSGFDMLGVLMRVAARPKPQINIGAVDMSCAFVVCDITQHDLPIVYCSDIFERLTGYTKHEILGRNCRFLQAPDGKVQSGIKRKYVDDQAVLHLKNMINQRQEAQISLINYRKGGQPFMNLLTMIPITYDSNEMKYYVGFQVDLVEQPTSITNKNPGRLSL
jgi:PAS domain-containing protein